MSTNATSADPAASLSVPTDVLTDAFVPLAPTAGQRGAQLRRQLLSADVLSGSVCGAIVSIVSGLGVDKLPIVALAVGLGWPVLAYFCGLYASEDLRSWASGVGDAPRLAVTSLMLSWPLFGLLTALDASGAVLGALTGTALAAAGAGLARAGARAALHRTPELRQRTLDALGDLIRLGRVDRVIIAFSRASHEDLLKAIRVCRDAGVTVDIVPRLFEFLDGARTIEQIGGMPLMEIRQPTFSPLSRATKRTLDIVGASLALLALSPLMAAIAIAIRLDSRGRVFFTQMRSGRDGRLFTLYKFRSMRTDSTVLVRTDGAIEKAPDDQRITRVGRLLRRFSLDEAPQLLNVLKGDMSLVGPRPLVLEEQASLDQAWQARRADLRPGLTGPWQVSGRSHIPFQDMIKFDYQYVAGWSLARDVEILLATLPAVLTGRGAY